MNMQVFFDYLEAKAKEKGKLLMLNELVKDKVLTLKQAAERMGMSVAKFKAATKELAIN